MNSLRANRIARKSTQPTVSKWLVIAAIFTITGFGAQLAHAENAIHCRGYRNWNGSAAPAGKAGGYVKYQKVMEVCHTNSSDSGYYEDSTQVVTNCKTAGIIDGYYTDYFGKKSDHRVESVVKYASFTIWAGETCKSTLHQRMLASGGWNALRVDSRGTSYRIYSEKKKSVKSHEMAYIAYPDGFQQKWYSIADSNDISNTVKQIKEMETSLTSDLVATKQSLISAVTELGTTVASQLEQERLSNTLITLTSRIEAIEETIENLGERVTVLE